MFNLNLITKDELFIIYCLHQVNLEGQASYNNTSVFKLITDNPQIPGAVMKIFEQNLKS